MDYNSFALTMEYINSSYTEVETFDELLYSLWSDVEAATRGYAHDDGFSKEQLMDVLAYVTGDGCAVISNYFSSMHLAKADMDYNSFALTMQYIEDRPHQLVETFDQLIFELWHDVEGCKDEDCKKQLMDILAYVTGEGCAAISNYFLSQRMMNLDTEIGHYAYRDEY